MLFLGRINSTLFKADMIFNIPDSSNLVNREYIKRFELLYEQRSAPIALMRDNSEKAKLRVQSGGEFSSLPRPFALYNNV